jgi:hypothetical protein
VLYNERYNNICYIFCQIIFAIVIGLPYMDNSALYYGTDDTIVSLAVGQRPVDALKQVGGNVRFSVLEGHDHDVWTDTYSDPQFYDWLLILTLRFGFLFEPKPPARPE